MRHRVLLVDDDLEMLALFRGVLERQSFDVSVARTALDALDVLLTRPVAIVVTDERMPGMTGNELLAHVQSDFPDAIRIMLTGAASVEVAQRAINDGRVFRFLTKPVRPVELVATLRAAVEAWERGPGTPALPGSRTGDELERLEREWRGLTHVERDESGAVVVDDAQVDPDAVLREMQGGSIRSSRLH